MNTYIKTLTVISLAMLALSCDKESSAESGNIEKIYADQGRPVKTRILEEDLFVSSLDYISTVKGIKESTGSSMVSDAVEDILVKVGDYVEKDQTVILFPENNLSANFYQAEAAFKAAELAYKRVENLYKNNGISRQSFDDAKTQYKVQQANWENVQGLVQVKAPISGYITRINVSPSDNVKPNTELFTVSNYDQLTTTVRVNDRDIRAFSVGQRVTARWEGESIEGVVSQVDLAKDIHNKAFAIKILLENQDLAIPSGVTADLSIEVESVEDAIVLHRREFLSNSGESYVFLEKEGYARKQIIETGDNQGMYYQIDSGLYEGDHIITEGMNLVREDEKIRVLNETDSTMAKR